MNIVCLGHKLYVLNPMHDQQIFHVSIMWVNAHMDAQVDLEWRGAALVSWSMSLSRPLKDGVGISMA